MQTTQFAIGEKCFTIATFIFFFFRRYNVRYFYSEVVTFTMYLTRAWEAGIWLEVKTITNTFLAYYQNEIINY